MFYNLKHKIYCQISYLHFFSCRSSNSERNPYDCFHKQLLSDVLDIYTFICRIPQISQEFNPSRSSRQVCFPVISVRSFSYRTPVNRCACVFIHLNSVSLEFPKNWIYLSCKYFLESTACSKACPYNYDPYCGNDGVTYSNWCLFEVAQCEDQSVMLQHRGLCKGKISLKALHK